MKLPGTATTSVDGPKLMARAVVSALDGLLEAERLANVTGALATNGYPSIYLSIYLLIYLSIYLSN